MQVFTFSDVTLKAFFVGSSAMGENASICICVNDLLLSSHACFMLCFYEVSKHELTIQYKRMKVLIKGCNRKTQLTKDT